jgi:septum formation protein
MTRIILASGSPRRRELLAALVADFDVVPSDVPELMHGDPVDDAVRLARAKSRAIADDYPDAVVIGADTIVHDGRRAYGKPRNHDDALAMWQALRGRTHRVVTGIAVIRGGYESAGSSESRVELVALSDAQVERYIASQRPMDKAGAYAIQDEDVPTVTSLEGCYCCVVGLPLRRLYAMLTEAGVICADPAVTIPRCATCPERPAA